MQGLSSVFIHKEEQLIVLSSIEDIHLGLKDTRITVGAAIAFDRILFKSAMLQVMRLRVRGRFL